MEAKIVCIALMSALPLIHCQVLRRAPSRSEERQFESLKLYCRTGSATCSQLGWTYKRRIRGEAHCCPALPGQRFFIITHNQAPDTCKCKVGAEDQYADIIDPPGTDVLLSDPNCRDLSPRCDNYVRRYGRADICYIPHNRRVCCNSCTRVALNFANSTTELYCRSGAALCSWLGWTHTGTFNGRTVCCPAAEGQGFTMNTQLAAPADCKCRAGNEAGLTGVPPPLTG